MHGYVRNAAAIRDGTGPDLWIRAAYDRFIRVLSMLKEPRGNAPGLFVCIIMLLLCYFSALIFIVRLIRFFTGSTEST